jgi:flagellar basal-body rod modification protein FlgD
MAFLELLVAEMANQDPLDPMDDTDFIAQLAQFSTLEEMENMNTSTMKSQGIDLIGKTVTASLSSTTESYVTGTVDSVIYNSGDVYLDIEGNVVSLDNIKEILETTSANNDSEE